MPGRPTLFGRMRKPHSGNETPRRDGREPVIEPRQIEYAIDRLADDGVEKQENAQEHVARHPERFQRNQQWLAAWIRNDPTRQGE